MSLKKVPGSQKRFLLYVTGALPIDYYDTCSLLLSILIPFGYFHLWPNSKSASYILSTYKSGVFKVINHSCACPFLRSSLSSLRTKINTYKSHYCTRHSIFYKACIASETARLRSLLLRSILVSVAMVQCRAVSGAETFATVIISSNLSGQEDIQVHAFKKSL